MTDWKKTIGHRLQLLRLERNLTQEQLAEQLHLSTSAYCKIERGETELTLTRLRQIAGVFHLSPVTLLELLDCHPGEQPLPTPHPSHQIDDLRELIKSNTRLIDLLCKRVDALERGEYKF